MGFKERANRMKRNPSYTQCVAFIGIALIIVGSFLPYWSINNEEGDISDEIMRWGDAGSRSWWTVDITPASSGFHAYPIEYKSIHYD